MEFLKIRKSGFLVGIFGIFNEILDFFCEYLKKFETLYFWEFLEIRNSGFFLDFLKKILSN